MFLATLDKQISADVLDTLYEANIQITTTSEIKESYYADNDRVLTFEKLLEICSFNNSHWEKFSYTVDQKKKIIELIDKQIIKHRNHKFVEDYYLKRKNKIK